MPRRRKYAKPPNTNIAENQFEIRECLFCHKLYTPRTGWQKYCCQDHSIAAYYVRKFAKSAAAIPADAQPLIRATHDELNKEMDINLEEALGVVSASRRIDSSAEAEAENPLTKLGYDLDEKEDKK
jgi:hypothetical protein